MKTEMTKALADLVKPRTIITLLLFSLFTYCVVIKLEISPLLSGFLSSLMTFWFVEKAQANGKNKESNNEPK